MINKANFQSVVSALGFTQKSDKVWSKSFPALKCELEVDFEKERLKYSDKLTVYDETVGFPKSF